MGSAEEAVLAFLKRRGYAASEQLEEEMQRSADPAIHQPEGAVRDRAQLLASGDASPVAHKRAYESLARFVERSLDRHRPELHRALFLVLVHSFLHLVELNQPSAAHSLLAAHSEAHEHLHHATLSQLRQVASAEDLQRSDLAMSFLSHRTPLSLSRSSLDLLLKHLQHSDNTIALSILNDNLSVHPRDGEPDSLEEQPEDPRDPSARLGVPVHPLPQSQRWGEHSNASETHADAQGDQPMGSGAHHIEQPTLGVLEQQPERQAEESVESEYEPVQSKLPLPRQRPAVDESAIEEARKQARLSANGTGTLPSVCFFTLTHTSGNLCAADASSSGSYVAGGFDDSTVKLWDVENAPAATRQSGKGEHPMPHSRLCGHSGPVYGVSFSPDQEFLLSGAFEGGVRLWHCRERLALARYDGHRNPVWDVAFSPVGHYFASASHDHTARVFSADCEHARRVFAGHTADVDCVAWPPSCNYIATASCDRTARLWDVHSGETMRIFAGQLSMLTCIACSPDGKEIAVGAEDGSVSVWDISSAKRRLLLRKHAGAVWSVAYSRDATVLVSASEDCSLAIWDASTAGASSEGNEQQATKGGSSPEVRAAAMSLPTKAAGVAAVTFTRRNLCLGIGPR